MANKIVRRNFWNLCRGKSIGFIESVYRGGVLIQTDFTSFRETSSNLSNGNVIEFSISKLAPNEKKILEDAMYKKIPVTIEFSKELIGSPFKGDLFECRYMNSVKLLNDEVVNVKL